MSSVAKPEVSKKKKGKGKKNRKSRGKSNPTEIYGTFTGGLTATPVAPGIEDEGIDFDAVYRKEDATMMVFDRDDIPDRQTRGYSSYELYWKMPGNANFPAAQDIAYTSGSTLHKLEKTEISIENVCDNTIWFRTQRAMGYNQDPSAVSMWEPIGSGNRELKPRDKWSFTVNHINTNVGCPRVVNVGGSPHLHIMSWLCFKEPQTDSGTVLTRDANQSGYTMRVTHTYVASSNDISDKEVFRILSFSGSVHMDHVDPYPSPSVNLRTLVAKTGSVHGAAFCTFTTTNPAKTTEKSKNIVMVLYESDPSKGDLVIKKALTSFIGLDIDTAYRPEVCPPLSAYVGGSWIDVDHAWLVYNDGKTHGRFAPGWRFPTNAWTLVYPGLQSDAAAYVWSPVKERSTNPFTQTLGVRKAWTCSLDFQFRPAGKRANMLVIPGGRPGVLETSALHPSYFTPAAAPPPCRRGRLSGRLALPVRKGLLEDSWWETTLSAVRIILQVMKTAMAVAATFGIVAVAQNVANPRAPGRPRALDVKSESSDSEYEDLTEQGKA